MSWNPSHKQGWKAASIYDPATGDVVQVNDIDHALSGLGFEEIINELATSKSQSGWEAIFRLGTTDMEGIDQIEEWMENQTPVCAVVAGSGKNVQWYEAVPITQFKRTPSSNRRDGDSRWSCALEFAGGYNMQIYNNVNLLHQTNVAGSKVTGWADEDGDDQVDGYIKGASWVANNFENYTQTITSDEAAAHGLYRNVVFPISGIKVTNSTYIVTEKVSGWGVTLNLRSFDSSLLIHDMSGSSESRNSGSTTTTSTTYIVRSILVRDLESGNEYELSQPALRTDGSSEYIAG